MLVRRAATARGTCASPVSPLPLTSTSDPQPHLQPSSIAEMHGSEEEEALICVRVCTHQEAAQAAHTEDLSQREALIDALRGRLSSEGEARQRDTQQARGLSAMK